MDLPIYREHWTQGREDVKLDIRYEYGVFRLLQEPLIVVQHRDQNWSQYLAGTQVEPLRLFDSEGNTVGYMRENYSLGSSIKSSVIHRGSSDRPFSVEVFDKEWNLVLYIKQQSSWDKKERINVYIPGHDQFGRFQAKPLGCVDITGPLAKRDYNLKVYDVAEEKFDSFGHIITSPRASKFAVRTLVPGDAVETTMAGVDIDWNGLKREAFKRVPIYAVRFDLQNSPGVEEIYHNIDGNLMYDMRAVLLAAAISLDHAYFSKFK
ncbi:hypothetical protein DIURU_000991 [Diutina rugosa]|uniref:Phospholipid scramblase n=1 Tax=Diutina rugosa TaxID=5481 RepID=A0A642UW24_DIURU|nr:uncharacterized protein DIURU_000991 [Diutina rugosa]KAA8906582.1 hypothetical protein DIURU_000991 [Diutina rugosa]